MNTNALIFSKDRAMQLDLCLNTLYKCAQDVELPRIDVLYTTSNSAHDKSYIILKREHPYVNFVEETNFYTQTIDLLNKKHVLFVTDDTIFCKNFWLSDIEDVLEAIPRAIGFSLRLGKNTHYCYPLGENQECPAMYKFDKNIHYYSWYNASFDFGYPLEVSSSVYRTSDILELITHPHIVTIPQPNVLEAYLHRYALTLGKDLIFCYNPSRAFANPINRVQNLAPNKFGVNYAQFSASHLLQKYLEGYRVDYNKFYEVIPTGAHMEYRFSFVERREDE